jgi:AcrR family transcriptional regulator
MTPSGLRAAKRLATWRAIRQAALDLTDERGWDAVSISEVATRAEVSERTVFNYFGSKNALLFDPDPETFNDLRSFVAGLPEGLSMWEALEQVMINMVVSSAAKLATIARLLESHPELFHSVSTHAAGYQQHLTEALAERLGPTDSPLTVPAACAAANGIATVALSAWNPDAGRDALAQRVSIGVASRHSGTGQLLPCPPPTSSTSDEST